MWFVKHRCLSIITINQQLCGHHFAWQPGCVEKSTCQVRGVTSFPSKEQWNSHSESVRCPLRASPVNKMSKHLLIREHRTQDVKASKASDGNSWRAWLWGSLESSQSSEVVSPGGTNDCRRGFTASLWETGAFTLHVHGPKSSGRFWDVLFFFWSSFRLIFNECHATNSLKLNCSNRSYAAKDGSLWMLLFRPTNWLMSSFFAIGPKLSHRIQRVVLRCYESWLFNLFNRCSLFQDEVRAKFPAMVHFDGTARHQSVSKNDEPWIHSLLHAVASWTGLAVLINTSFNSKGAKGSNMGDVYLQNVSFM